MVSEGGRSSPLNVDMSLVAAGDLVQNVCNLTKPPLLPVSILDVFERNAFFSLLGMALKIVN